MSYLQRRLLLCGAQVIALSLVAFLLLSVAPGHFLSLETLDPQRSAASIEIWMRSHGLSKPWPARYLDWLRSCAAGDWGTSLAYGSPVWPLLVARASRTLAVVIPAWLLGWTLGLAAAFLSAGFRLLSYLEPIVAIAAMIPEVIAGSLLLWLAVAVHAPIDGPWLPAGILTVSVAAIVFLHAAHALDRARDARFVQLAKDRGIAGRLLWAGYILPAAGNPLLPLLAPSLVGAVGSSLAIETLTGWPGLGPLFLEAFHARDYPVVQAVLTMLAIALTILNLLADLMLYRLDPRIRFDHETSA